MGNGISELKDLDVVGFNQAEKITFVSGPVVIENDRVLLVRKKGSSVWQFPGGTCIQGESFEDTAVREVKEELGVDIEIEGNPFVHILNKDNKLYILLHFKSQIVSGGLKAGNEIEEFLWQEIDKLDSIEVFDNITSATNYFKEP